MTRRRFAGFSVAAASLLVRRGIAAPVETASESIKGKLVQSTDSASLLAGSDARRIALTGDEDTQKVLHDPRLADASMEALGHFTAPDSFAVGPIFEKNMFVLRDGNRLRITYWCDVCSIRTYAPGVCVCCQKWTDLDLRDPNQE